MITYRKELVHYGIPPAPHSLHPRRDMVRATKRTTRPRRTRKVTTIITCKVHPSDSDVRDYHCPPQRHPLAVPSCLYDLYACNYPTCRR